MQRYEYYFRFVHLAKDRSPIWPKNNFASCTLNFAAAGMVFLYRFHSRRDDALRTVQPRITLRLIGVIGIRPRRAQQPISKDQKPTSSVRTKRESGLIGESHEPALSWLSLPLLERIYHVIITVYLFSAISLSKDSYTELLLLYSGTISFILRTVAMLSNCFAMSTSSSMSRLTLS